MKRILSSLIVISFAASLSALGTNAYFSDTETSQDNLLQAGAIDLKIDNTSYYNGEFNKDTSWEVDDLTGKLFFDFDDLKPGDLSEDTISFHVDTNDSWLCSNVTLTSTPENDITEPESEVDDEATGDWDGELGDELNFVFWTDDGDNVLEEGERVLLQGKPSSLPQGDDNPGLSFPLVDSTFNAWGDVGDPFPGGETKYIAKAWCFGDLTVDPTDQDGEGPLENNGPDDRNPGVSCDGAPVTNISQSDGLTGDVTFTAIQSRNNDDFECGDCIKGPVYAADSLKSLQGLRKNGTPVLPERSNPDNALGAPNGVFFSLGFGGIAVFTFDHPVLNVSGDDLSFHEITNGRNTYPLEKAQVRVSQDLVTWYSLGQVDSEPSGDGVTYKDFDSTGLSWIKYLEIKDTTNPAIHNNEADGYDLDALDAVRIDSCRPIDERPE